LARATASATGGIGSFTPVHECTHVTPTARVFGVMARSSRDTISAAFALTPSSYRDTYLTPHPERSAAKRIDSCWE
jgi:hypothetical protein